jgi:hypothetical protein
MPLFACRRRGVAASGRRPVWLGRRQAVRGKPASELLRGTDSAVNHGGADLQATDLLRIFRPTVPVVFDAQHRAALLGGDALAQYFVPACDIPLQVVQPHGQVDLPNAAPLLHGEGHLVPLIADLTGHAPTAALVVILQAGDSRPHNPRQQARDVLGREVTAREHRHIQLTPAHQTGDKAASDQQRTDIGDQCGQVQPGQYLPRLILQRRLPGRVEVDQLHFFDL